MNKVLVTVLTADHSPYLKRIQACRETWIQHAPSWATVWIMSPNKLGVPDEYDKMTYKIQALAKRALGVEGWEWLLRIDDDVCVNWNVITPPTSGDYLGLEVPLKPDNKFPYVAGAVTWLSRRAVEVIAQMKPAKGVVEDHEVGRLLNAAGIQPTFLPLYTVVRRPTEAEEIDAAAVTALRTVGFVLETGSPDNMRTLHAALNLAPRSEQPSSVVQDMKNPVVAQPRGQALNTGTTYRDHQGKYVVRGAAVFNEPTQQSPQTGAIARPDTDPGWHDDRKHRVLRQAGG